MLRLKKPCSREEEALSAVFSARLQHNIMVPLGSFLPCSLRRRARRNGTQMQCPRTPYTGVPFLPSLERDKQSSRLESRVIDNRDLNRKEGCKLALTGECACKTTGSLGNCGVAVGC